MGRWTRRDVRRDFLRDGAGAGACHQAEGRLLLRQPPGALLGGFQSTPLDRRQSRSRARPAEEARRRAEARLESLFRRDRSPPRRYPSQEASRDAADRNRSHDHVSVQNGSDTDSSSAMEDSRHQTVAAETRASSSRTSARQRRSISGRQDSANGKQTAAGNCQNSAVTSSQVDALSSHGRPTIFSKSPAARTAGTSAQSASHTGPRSAGPTSDWSVGRPDNARVLDSALSPDEGEGLTPAPTGTVRIEDFVDTVLGEVTSQLERMAGTSPEDEDKEKNLALYRQQQPPALSSDCRLARRLRGEREIFDGTSQSSASQPPAVPVEPGRAVSLTPAETAVSDDQEEFVLQLCTSSQEDAEEQDPLRYLRLAEAAGGIGWLDGSPAPAAVSGPLRQEDLLLVRSGAVPCRPPPPPPETSSACWLEAAAVSSPPPKDDGWPDWRGGGDILDSVDARRPCWRGGTGPAVAKSYASSYAQGQGRETRY